MQEGNFVTPVDNEERHIYISQIKEVSISNWGDILRTGSNGSLSHHIRKSMSSHPPLFGCARKNLSNLALQLSVTAIVTKF